MERKIFIRNCAWMCSATLLTPLLLEGCTSVYHAASSVEGNTIKVKKSEFNQENGEARKFVVVRNERLEFPVVIYFNSESKYTALYLKCPHRGCEVTPSETLLVCPCHGSEFNVEGKVLSPPADQDLTHIPLSLDNENILLQV